MIAQELEQLLHDAFVATRRDRHEFITVEHLLLALLDAPSVVNALHLCGAKPEELRRTLAGHIADHTPVIPGGSEVDTQPTVGFQRVIQRAILRVHSTGAKEVTSVDALAAIFGENDSRAARVLEQHGVTAADLARAAGDRDRTAPATPSRSEAEPVGGLIAQELEVSLHMAFVDARQKRYEVISVEHLLLTLLDNTSAAEVLRGCGANMSKLRKDVAQQVEQAPRVPVDRELDTQPTPGFQRVLQEAIRHLQAVGKKEVAGADVLVAIFNQKEAPAVEILAQHGITRFDVVFYRTHRVAPMSGTEADAPDAADLQVVLYNDDYTPMQFVVDVLEKFFSMSRNDATETMLEVHRQGVAVCGLYGRDEAWSLMKSVLHHARQHGHPLHCGVVVPK